VLPGNQSPEPGRKELLQFFGLTETQLREYKALPLDEAEWRLDHEHRVHLAWEERRRAFLEGECLQPRSNGNRPHANQNGNGPVQPSTTGLEAIRSEADTDRQLTRTRTRSTL
jgi:hypothetical protein